MINQLNINSTIYLFLNILLLLNIFIYYYYFKKSIEENGWIPKYLMKPRKSSLKAIFLGSIGKNEPKWRSFWAWNDKNITNVENHHSNTITDINNNEQNASEIDNKFVAPETQCSQSASQSSQSASPPTINHSNNNHNNNNSVL